MNNTSGDDYHGAHARLDAPRRIELSSEPAEARRQLERVLARQWPDEVADVQLAVSEALVNANRHAGGARRAEVLVNDACVMVQVWDHGQGFDPTPYTKRPPDVMAERGRGLWLISRLADRCEVARDDEGAHVVLRFEARRDPPRRERPVVSRPA